MAVNAAGTPESALPPVMTVLTPRNSVPVPRVASIAGTFSLPISKPFSIPHSAPAARAAAKASSIAGQLCAKEADAGMAAIRIFPMRMAHRLAMYTTDRSMPPDSIQMNTATARMPYSASCLKMDCTLRWVRKPLCRDDPIISTATSSRAMRKTGLFSIFLVESFFIRVSPPSWSLGLWA